MIDLHMHSRYSADGEYAPAKLVEKCLEKGIHKMSITDHNCAKANEEAKTAAKEKGITYLSGIEIDCVYQDINFHVLGYGIDDKSEDFAWIEENVRKQSLQASYESLAKTQKLGFHVTEEDMRSVSKDSCWQETWTGEMFAEVLLAKPAIMLGAHRCLQDIDFEKTPML